MSLKPHQSQIARGYLRSAAFKNFIASDVVRRMFASAPPKRDPYFPYFIEDSKDRSDNRRINQRLEEFLAMVPSSPETRKAYIQDKSQSRPNSTESVTSLVISRFLKKSPSYPRQQGAMHTRNRWMMNILRPDVPRLNTTAQLSEKIFQLEKAPDSQVELSEEEHKSPNEQLALGERSFDKHSD